MKQPIRILHVIGKMDRAGAETLIMNLYRNINRGKVQFDFVVHSQKEGDYDQEIKSLGGRIFYMPNYSPANIIGYKRAWNEFLKKNHEYKIIHGHLGSVASIYLGVAKKYGLFTIAHSHNTYSKFSIKQLTYQISSYPTRYIADYFFACSAAAGRERYGSKVIRRKNYKILANAIQFDDFEYSENTRKKVRNSLGIRGKFVVGHVGRFNTQKNHEFLIEIFREIRKKKDNAVLLLVGVGEEQSKIYNKVEKYGMLEDVKFLGLRDDIPQLLQAFDIFLFPSMYEGLPVALIEAQAASLPCVVSSVITEEVDIKADLIGFVTLDSSLAVWADKVIAFGNKERKSTRNSIEKSGYNIIEVAKWLQEFYIQKIEELK